MKIVRVDCGLQSSKRTKPVTCIVCHHTVTRTPEATQRVLRARGVSTHYEVGPDGSVYEYLDPATRVAWHARAWNSVSVGVDLTGPPGRTDCDPVMPYPEMQVAAFAALVRDLARRFGIPVEPVTVRAWKRDPILMNAYLQIVPHSAIQRGKVDPSDWRLDGTAWDTVLRPAILRE